MTELSFAKTFLSTLDSKPPNSNRTMSPTPKPSSPKAPYAPPSLLLPTPLTSPKKQYTLPRTSQPMRPRTASTSPLSPPTKITITLKSTRNPPLSLTLPAQDLGTSVMELKTAVSNAVRAKGTEGIKVLYNKKPCADSKTVKDVLGDGEVGEEVEFGVMIMGAAAAAMGTEGGQEGKEGGEKMDVDTAAPVAQGPSGDEVLEGEEFWEDLKGFLSQRLKDEGKAREVVEVFRTGWKGKGAGGGSGWAGKWGGIKGWKTGG
ncbi:hypothetical protein G7Y79_00001g003780 [Physcia stellaris]|nr:hypothetical protein G7Y79_00001g003780 [Physcia stellaris]